ncbi:hypothetical protein D9M68_957740 [compost metagenome]
MAITQPAGEYLVQRVQGDRQDHCPEHQVEERMEDAEAEQRQQQNQPCADKHVQQVA